MMRDI